MKSPEIKVCPSCGLDIPPVSERRANFVAECDWCAFYASTLDMVVSDYLANFYPLPDINVTALRIAGREPLMYWSAKMAS
jgi:hypothetical protein